MSIANKAAKAYLASKLGDRGADAVSDVVRQLRQPDLSAATPEDFHRTIAAIPFAQRVAKAGFMPLPFLSAAGKRRAFVSDPKILENPDLMAAAGPWDQWELFFPK